MPRVSVLLTCYNHIDYLPACVDGVFSQTFKDYEVIALDDGSTDGTREWLSEQRGLIKPVFNPENLGTYGTLNVGLQQATGEYIAILNDDDVWAPTKLESQVALLDANPKVGLVHTNGWFIDGSGEKHPEAEPLGFPFPSTGTGYQLPTLIECNKIIASSVLVRRECFDRLGGFEPTFYGCGDWHMWLRVAEHYDIGYADDPLTLYRVHSANACLVTEKMQNDEMRIRTWIGEHFGTQKALLSTNELLRRSVAHNMACLGTERTLLGDAASGRTAYAKSIRLMPLRFKSYFRWLATFLPLSTFRKTVKGAGG